MSNTTRAIMIMVLGVSVRLSANALAWPANYSYSGPRESTEWGIREAALNEIGMGLFYLGGLLFVGALLIQQHGGKPAARGSKSTEGG